MSPRAFTSRSRQGFTLLELLVVILIMLMLTGLAIPVIAPALANRQQREAARAVNAFIGGARERAIALGRPVGIKLERFAGQPDICTTLSYVEVPPPYSGDTLDARLAVVITNVIRHQPTADLALVQLRAFEQAAFTLTLDIKQVRKFDSLQLNYHGRTYRIIGPDAAPGDGLIDAMPLELETTVPMSTVVRIQNPNGSVYDTTMALPFLNANAQGFNSDLAPSHPYRIVDRLPVRSTGDPLELPEGTVIDLNFSGLDGFSLFPRRNNVYPNDPHYDDPSNLNDGPVPVATVSQLYLMFSPSGGLDRVWLAADLNANDYPDGVFGPLPPNGQVYLLVGKRELVRRDLYTLDPDITDPNAIHFNWQDLSSIWVTVNHRTGLVTSVENSVANPWPPQTGETVPITSRLRQARLLAHEAHSMGGR